MLIFDSFSKAENVCPNCQRRYIFYSNRIFYSIIISINDLFYCIVSYCKYELLYLTVECAVVFDCINRFKNRRAALSSFTKYTGKCELCIHTILSSLKGGIKIWKIKINYRDGGHRCTHFFSRQLSPCAPINFISAYRSSEVNPIFNGT